MKPPSSQAAAAQVIALYVAWNARALLAAWIHAPYDRCGSPAFLLWAAMPFFVRLSYSLDARDSAQPPVSAVLPAAALALTFAGIITDLSVLKDIALAVAIGAFLPLRPATFLWLALSVAWMPAAGWVFKSAGVVGVNIFRLVLGAAAIPLTPLYLRREPIG